MNTRRRPDEETWAVRHRAMLMVLAIGMAGAAQAAGPTLKVSDNGHYLVDAEGTPVFLAGDTAWRVVAQLTREETNAYLAKRKAQEFNTILMVMLPWSDEAAGTVNAYGDQPFYSNEGQCDLARPKTTPGQEPEDDAAYDYWDHVDFFVQRATEEGFFLACLPCWGGGWVNAKGNAFTESSAYTYGQWLGRRYHNARNIIWVLGGDVRPGDKEPVYRAMAEGLADGTNGVNQHDGAADYSTTLMTYHEPKVWGDNVEDFDTSATWFHADDWLDLNSCQEHPEKASRAILHDFQRKPVKPIWLFEGRYEAYQRDPKTPAWDAWGVRYQAYQSVFSGGFGHVYGHEGVFSFGRPTPKADDVDWRKNLDSLGALEMRHVGRLMKILTNSQYLSRIPARDLLAGPVGAAPASNDPRPGCDRVTATKAADGSIAMIYIANGRDVTIKMQRLAGPAADAYWYNPRKGTWRVGDQEQAAMTPALRDISSGSGAPDHAFDPPGVAGPGNDWVLVLRATMTRN